jgi:glycosyltransferase involved in cell wall biosynthesis
MQKTKIAVVTPVYNSRDFIRKNIESLLINDNIELNHIIVDNNSTDGTISEILRSINNSKKTFLYSKKDNGPASAINFGFKNFGDAQIIGWLNSDDYYAPGALSAVVKEFIAHPEYKIVYGKGRYVDITGNFIAEYPVKDNLTPLKDFQNGCFICQPSVFFRPEVFSDIGYLDPNLKSAFDFDYWIRIFRRYKRSQIGFINKNLSFSRLHSQCITSKDRFIVITESMSILAKYFKYSPINWIVTYVDELYLSYPFINDTRPLIKIVEDVLSKTRGLIKPVNFKNLINLLSRDKRLLFSTEQLFVGVDYDGWVSNKLLIKFRSDSGGPYTIKIECGCDWPIKKSVSIVVNSMDGSHEFIKLNSDDKFSIQLEVPKTLENCYLVWSIEMKQYFVPSKFNKQSKDHRRLSFNVKSVSV